VALVDLDVLLDAAEHAELGLDGDALGVRLVDDALGDLDVLVERLVRASIITELKKPELMQS